MNDVSVAKDSPTSPEYALGKLHEGIQLLSMGICVFAADLTLQIYNKYFQQMIGLPEELVHKGAPLATLLHHMAERGELGAGNKDEIVLKMLEPLKNMAEPYIYERRRPNGMHLQIHTTPLESGGFITIHTDISLQKQKEEDLRRSRTAMEVRMLERSEELRKRKAMEAELAARGEWLQFAVDNIPGGMVLFDKDLRYYLWTSGVEKLWDLPADFLKIGLPYEEVLAYFVDRGDFGPGDKATLIEEQIRPLRERETLHTERRLPNGTILDVKRNRLPNGGLVNLFYDITREKRMEEELAAKTELMQSAIDNMPGGMVIFDNDLRFTQWSRGIEPLFGIPAGTLQVGLPYETLLRLYVERGDFGPGNIDALVEEKLRPLRAREPVLEERLLPNGRIVEARRNPMPAGGYVSVYQDITERK